MQLSVVLTYSCIIEYSMGFSLEAAAPYSARLGSQALSNRGAIANTFLTPDQRCLHHMLTGIQRLEIRSMTVRSCPVPVNGPRYR